MHQLSDTVNRKFTDAINVDDYEIETDSGWVSITHLCKTIPYDVWAIETVNGSKLECADDHILFDSTLSQVFCKNLRQGDLVYTKDGPVAIKSITKTNRVEQMFDVRVNHVNHRFWSGDFLSHNTTIINAITYALYNKPFDSISLQKLINSTNNMRNTLMEIRLSFTKGEDEFEVYRCRGEITNISLSMNGEDITYDSVSENDSALQEIIGMSYELFTKIIVFSGNSTPFLQMPVSQQRQQIEELFNITLLSEKAVKLKEMIRATEGTVAVQEAVIKEQEAQVSAYERQLKDAASRVQRWEDDHVRQVQALTEQLELLSTVDMSVERECHEQATLVLKQMSTLHTTKSNLARDKGVIETEVRKLSEELEHLLEAKCPYCLQQYEGAEDKLTEKVGLLESRQEALETVVGELSIVTAEHDAQRKVLAELQDLMKFSTLAEAVRAESNAASAQQKIDDLITAENPHTEAYEQLKDQVMKAVSYTELDSLRKEVEHQQFLLKLLTDKNSFIRRKIINRTIPFLNNRLIHYTKELGLPHIVKFDDDMSCTVSEYCRELDFGNLSSGEKKRVNLSLSLAFRDVLHHLHSRVNCLFIDEIDASLDGSGVENVFKLLKQKTRDEGLGMWIISHRPESIGRFDRTVTVRKENGFSRIVDEEGELAA
jgi:hypothetical protein